MRYFLITYGCQINKSDSERIAAKLEKIGYKSAPDIQRTDLIVVNMCSVRQSAVDRVNGKIKDFTKLKAQNPNLKILLTGCILKSDLKRFKNLFDYILSIKALPYWQDILQKNEFIYYPDLRTPRIHTKFKADYFKNKPGYSNKFSAYVPIMTGCNNFCTYCVVPYARGPQTSRPTKEIIKEIKALIKKGFKEIWLLGHNVNSYGVQYRATRRSTLSKTQNHTETTFPKLLKLIHDIPGNFWISFTSSHPNDFSDELIKTIAESKKISKYINLPIQSGDDEILLKMNRPYTIQDYKKIIKKIRKAIPEIFLSTDIIVGFPGETKKQFNNTLKLFKELKFDMAYIAEYSPRPGTTAFKMKDDVPKKEKQERRETLTKVLEKTSIANSKKYIGTIVNVLIHEITKKGALVGKTPFYKTIKILPSPPIKNSSQWIGQIVKVKIVGAMPWGLETELVL